MFKLFFTSILFAVSLELVVSAEWNYDIESDHGPNFWGDVVAGSSCNGQRQSPIALVTSSIPKVTGHKQLAIVNIAKKPQSIHYKNTGHGFSVSFTFADGVQPNLVWGPLNKARYVFASFHLHWRAEHEMDGISYPAEFHAVHYNRKYGSLDAAITQPDGLAVLGFFVSQSGPNVPNTVRPMINNAAQVIEAGSTATFTSELFSLLDIFRARRFSVYSYPGSLTSPSCNEVVTWLVSNRTISLTPAEIELLRTVKDNHGHYLLKNNRPVQPLNGRIVKFYP